MKKSASKLHQCSTCGHRFKPWHPRAPRICRPCGELVIEINRVAGPQFITQKSILAARARELLVRPAKVQQPGHLAKQPPALPASKE